MQVQLDKRFELQVSPEQAWAVLGDIRAVAGCMPGAQITEQVDETHYKGTVKSKVGPAVMAFGGDIEVLGLDPAARRLEMLGKGADKGGSSASMNLAAHVEDGATPGTSTLVGVATVVVNGKLAQFGSRLLVPVSDAMLEQFANNFRVAAAAVPAAVPAATPAAPAAEAAPAGEAVDAPGATATAAASAEAEAASSTASPVVAPAAAAPTARAPAPAAAAPVPTAPKELNALGLMWIVFKGWIAGLFGRKR